MLPICHAEPLGSVRYMPCEAGAEPAIDDAQGPSLRPMHDRPLILGIHGLANKPPIDEKTRWWRTAIAEGLASAGIDSSTTFCFAFVYWADLRYDAPLAADAIVEPHLPHDGRGALPSGKDAPTISGKDVLATVYEGIDRIEEATGITLVDDLILEHRFDDLWHHHVEREFARQVRARLSDRIRHLRGHRILLVAHSMGSAIVMTCCVS